MHLIVVNAPWFVKMPISSLAVWYLYCCCWNFFPFFRCYCYPFLSPSSPCNVVPLIELLIENKKHPNFEQWVGGRGVDSFVPESYPI